MERLVTMSQLRCIKRQYLMTHLIGRNTFVAVTAVTVTEGKKTALAGGKKSALICWYAQIRFFFYCKKRADPF